MKKVLSQLRNSPNKTLTIGILLFFALINIPVLTSHSASLPKQQAKAIAQTCKDAVDRCYAEQFESIASTYPLDHTLQTLEALQNLEVRASGCHFIGHIIGEAEVKKDPSAWQDRIAHLPITDCSGGFLMGALEAHKQSDQSFVLNKETITDLCTNVQEKTKQRSADQTCVHTSGHLLLIDTKANVGKAIDTCRELSTVFQYECFSGVFMENIYRRNLEEHDIGKALVWNEKTFAEQQHVCLQYYGKASQACWRELSHMILSIANKNPERVAMLCNGAPEQYEKDACYLHAVGVMLLTMKESENLINTLCKPYGTTKERLEECIRLTETSDSNHQEI